MSSPANLFMFSGQGSHYYQMGHELFQQEPVFKQTLFDLDEMAQTLLGRSVISLLYHENKQKSDTFDRTVFTSPAIFMIEYALAQTLISRGIRPAGVFGVSLGIYAAACIAGSMTAEDALATVIKQAEILEKHCPSGAMVAVLAGAEIHSSYNDLREHSDLASINTPSHCVISTTKEKLPVVLQCLSSANLAHQTLSVSQAFHSRWIDSAQDPCKKMFSALKIKTPNLPIVCSAQQGPLFQITPEALWNIMRQPIHLAGTIQYLESEGPYNYIDAGPASTLATLLKHSLPDASRSAIHGILSPFPGEHKKYLRFLDQTKA